jgi:thiol:disulfide interchange protein DsbD
VMKKLHIPTLLIAFLLLTARVAHTQLSGKQYIMVSAASVQAQPGKPFHLDVTLDIQAGYHIQANNARAPYIPTRVQVTAPKGFKVAHPLFPKPKKATVAGDQIDVFEGRIAVRIPITPPTSAKGRYQLLIKVSYQACNDQSCFPPTEASAQAEVNIGPAKKKVEKAMEELPPASMMAATDFVPPTGGNASGVPGFEMSKLERFAPPEEFIRFLQTGSTNGDAGAGRLGTLLGSGNLLLALPLIFLLGLALNLTPCVYPIIPITISYFGSQSHEGHKPVVLALFYVLGMAVMYSVLGVVAGLTGGLFGSQLQNPWVLSIFALVMFALALSQFDRKDGRPIWEFQLPAALRNKAGSRSGILGAMLMGLMVGVVAAPCIGPAVVALLQWVGTQKNAVLGFVTFFTLALGLGLPYIFLATASGSVKKLPRSGEWMIGVKHIFGVIMIWMGFYYLQTVLNSFRPGLGHIALVAATALGGLYFLFLDRAGASAAKFFAFKRALGIGALALAVWLALPAPAEAIHWQPYSAHVLEQARREGKKVLIDFTAAWCAQCKELEHKTFSKREVGLAARDFVALRADMTDFNGPRAQKLKEQYGIVGLPTVVRLVPKEEAVAQR